MAADHGKKVVLADEEQNPGGVCLPFARRRQIGQVSLGQSMTDG